MFVAQVPSSGNAPAPWREVQRTGPSPGERDWRTKAINQPLLPCRGRFVTGRKPAHETSPESPLLGDAGVPR